jgi:hypothetical protein
MPIYDGALEEVSCKATLRYAKDNGQDSPETSFASLINRAPRPRSPFTVPLSIRGPVPHGARLSKYKPSLTTNLHSIPPSVSSAPLW